MIEWYRHLPERIDPVVFSAGFFSLHWYAVMYIVALCVGGYVLWRQTRKYLSHEEFVDLVFDLVIGILLGSRLGYVLLYNLPFYVAHPISIVWPFDLVTGEWIGIAGMSYYGGLIGAAIGLRVFARSCHSELVSESGVEDGCDDKGMLKQVQHDGSGSGGGVFFRVADAVVLAVPIGYFFGRIGNFLNGELYGRVTDTVWGMYFPDAPDGGGVSRHPSQLYEAFFEGLALAVVLSFARKRVKFSGGLVSVYLAGYGLLRFVLEFFREPDPQIGLLFGWLTLGQILSGAIFLIGVMMFFRLRRKGVI